MARLNRWRLGVVAAAVLALGGCINPPGMGLIPTGEVEVGPWDGLDKSEAGAWYYMELEDTTCANGSSSGLGLNVGEDRDELVIYLSGGGACWDVASCTFFKTAANLNVTYGLRQLGIELHALVEGGFMNRTDKVNPLPDATYAFVPYCTGDLHTGRTMTAYDGLAGGELIHHQGARNIDEYLRVLTELFPDVERVWLVGISAGGYGVSWNFDRFREAYPDAEMHVYTDASPWLELRDNRWTKWKDNWGLTIPDGCEGCEESPTALPEYLADKYPNSRFAMSVYARDPVLSAYLGVLPAEVESAVNTFVDERYSKPNTSAFIADGSHHEALLNLNDGVKCSDGESLADFIARWVNGK